MFSFRKKDRYAPAREDYRDGRTFDPLAVRDTLPRLVITVETTAFNEDGTNPVHLDYFNIPVDQRERVANELLLIAQRIVTTDGAAQLSAAS